MKPFQTLLFFAVVILIGGTAALWWGKSIQNVTVPAVVEESADQTHVTGTELAAGTYLVFQVDDTEFFRLALDPSPLTSDNLVNFFSVDQPFDVNGGLVADVYGQDLLMHRYLGDRQDGIITLSGNLRETRAMHWGTIRSANGRYEVVWDSLYDDTRANMLVRNVETGEILVEIDEALFELGSERRVAEPFLVDDQGGYFYAREVCACEATLAGMWQVEIATGEVTRLDTLVDLDSWFLSSLHPTTRTLLAVHTKREAFQEGPGDALLPPTTIRILELNLLDEEELLVDDQRAWGNPWLDPEGKSRYVVTLLDEGYQKYLVDFADKVITQEHFLTNGHVLDWVGAWVVVHDNESSKFKLVNVETKEEVELEIPGEQVQYVGSVDLH